MIRFLARGLLFAFMALLLASCDSGNDSIDVPGVSNFNLTISTVNATTGVASNVTSSSAPLRVQATLTSSAGAAVPGATISFAATGVGKLATATAQTDGAGVATVVLNAGTSATPGTASPGVVSARFRDPSGNVASVQQAYSSMGDESSGGGGGPGTPTNVLRMTMAALNASNRTPISSTNPVSTDSPGVLSVLVTLDGVPVPNALVNFTSPGIASLAQASVATNNAGTAEVAIAALGNGAGVASATATVGSQQVSASTVISTTIRATAPVVLALGNGVGAGFTSGALLSSAGAVAVAAGSTITISADVVNTSGNVRYDTPVTVTFSSPCAVAGSSDLDSSALTVGGTVGVTYTPNSCTGTDTITATLRDGSRTLTATVNVSIQPPDLGQVLFVSATPTSIALADTGGLGRLTRSEVKFRVLSTTGAPIPKQLVCFGLSTAVGGLSVNASTITNTAGEAIAAVQAGSIPTSVRVQATVDSDGDNNCTTAGATVVSAVSDALSVSTGLPDQNSFSIAVSTHNPLAWEKFGTEVTVTAFAADHFNNPVPDGTAISFWSELGAIAPSCTTVRGVCSVIWRSQEPRDNFDSRAGTVIGTNGIVGRAINDRMGRSTILAYAVGEESFVDSNGNGRFDTGETFTDLSEALKDSNENGARDQPGLATFDNEEFIDFDRDGTMDGPNGRYDGVLCAPAVASCSGDATVNVRRSIQIVMSSRHPRVYAFVPGAFNPGTVDYNRTSDLGAMLNIPAEITSAGAAVGRSSVEIVVSDQNGNALPEGSVIEAEVSPSDAGKVSNATTSFTVPTGTEPFRATIVLEAPDLPVDGFLNITVTAGGVKQVVKSIPIDN